MSHHKNEKKTSLTRGEVGSELAALAQDLGQGLLRIGSRQIAVGEPVFFKSKQKLVGDMVYFTLSVKMRVRSEPDSAPAESAHSPATDTPPRRPPSMRSEMGYGGKRLKKEIAALWKTMVRLIEAEKMPAAVEIESLLKRCEEYALFAGKDWQADWRNCTESVRACLASAAVGDWPAARDGIAKIKVMIHDCHSRYK